MNSQRDKILLLISQYGRHREASGSHAAEAEFSASYTAEGIADEVLLDIKRALGNYVPPLRSIEDAPKSDNEIIGFDGENYSLIAYATVGRGKNRKDCFAAWDPCDGWYEWPATMWTPLPQKEG